MEHLSHCSLSSTPRFFPLERSSLPWWPNHGFLEGWGRGPCWHCSVKVVSAGVGGRRLVHVDGVEDPLCELLQLGRGAVRLLHQALVVLSQAFNLCLQRRLCVLLLVVTQPWMILSVTTSTKCYTCSGFPCEEAITHLLQILLEHLHHRLQLTDFSHQAGWGLSGRCTTMV